MHLGQVLVMRTSMNPATVSQFVRGIVEQVDADQAPDRVLTMDQRIAGSQSVSQGRFLASVFGLFGGLAILLAMVGIYGVMSYVVTLRSAEFGIRGALGATRGDLVVLLLRQLMKPTSVGVAMGLGGGIALTRLLSSAYSGLSQADPSAFVGVTLLMVGAALLAALLPARRASQVDPLEALKCE